MMSTLSPSPTTFASSAPEALMMSMKPGCRGDPRMNRAVAAKLENPHLSLYDALVIGGFNYPRNVDAATMDNELVTLGQRKNQLNRRLRTARKSQQKKAEKKQSDNDSTSSSSDKPPSALGASSLAIANSYIRERRNKAASKAKPTKRVAPVEKEQPSVEKEERRSKKQRLDFPSPAAPSSLAQDISLNTVVARSFMAERAQANISPLVGDIPSFNGSPSSNYNSNSISLCTVTQQDDSWWPASKYNALLNLHDGDMNICQPFEMMNAALGDDCMPEGCHGGLDLPQPSSGNKRSVSTISFENQQQQHQNNICSVTVPPEEDFADNNKKEELALLYFQTGLQELYQKSMMAAGYAPSETSDDSPAFHKFAFRAWKNECERLQVLLGDHTVEQGKVQEYF